MKKTTSQEAKPKKLKVVRGVTTRPGIERIFRMVSMIQNANQACKKITCGNLEAEFEVDRATVMRDIEFIRELLNHRLIIRGKLLRLIESEENEGLKELLVRNWTIAIAHLR